MLADQYGSWLRAGTKRNEWRSTKAGETGSKGVVPRERLSVSREAVVRSENSEGERAILVSLDNVGDRGQMEGLEKGHTDQQRQNQAGVESSTSDVAQVSECKQPEVYSVPQSDCLIVAGNYMEIISLNNLNT